MNRDCIANLLDDFGLVAGELIGIKAHGGRQLVGLKHSEPNIHAVALLDGLTKGEPIPDSHGIQWLINRPDTFTGSVVLRQKRLTQCQFPTMAGRDSG
jgi:hypothetical protein